MIYDSPLPDVEIPDLPLTEYVLAGGAGQPYKPALIDGASGAGDDLRRAGGGDPVHRWSRAPHRPLGGSSETPQPRYGCDNLHTLWCTLSQPYNLAEGPAGPAAPAL